MTRFEQELSGALGDFWKRSAEQEIAWMRERVDAGEVCLDDRGGAYWKSNGSYIPGDSAEVLMHTGFVFDPVETESARDIQSQKFLEEYRAHYRGPSEEEKTEMRAAFGPGTTVVDIITGREIYL